MRKLLIAILIVILLIILAVSAISGISVGSFKINSISEIIAANDELDAEIDALQTSIDTTYALAKTSVETSYKNLVAAKQSYQSAITYSTEEEIQAANQTEKYELSYLWTKIGLYATNNDVTMKAELSYGSSGVSDQYNISFTVEGEYLSISEFIYAIENDSELGFKIENFTLSPYSGDTLQATFIIKNIAIDSNSINSSSTTSTASTSDDSKETADTQTEVTSEY